MGVVTLAMCRNPNLRSVLLNEEPVSRTIQKASQDYTWHGVIRLEAGTNIVREEEGWKSVSIVALDNAKRCQYFPLNLEPQATT